MIKVALMCGHGRSTDGTWDCGTSYGGNNEAALMLPITKAAVKYLRSYGVTVISDADTNNNKNMIADVAWANKELATIYVSLHCDYYKAPSGTLPLFVSAKGRTLAAAINSAVVSGMGMKTRGVTKRTDLYELNYTDMPACIFETGSIKADISKLKNDPDKYGKCIAKGICNYLGVKAEAPTVSAPTTPTVSDGKLSVDGKGGKKTVKRLQEFLGCSTKDGVISGQNKDLSRYYPNMTSVEFGGGGSPTVKNLQKWVGANEDGIIGQITVKLLQKKLGVTQDGIAGANTIKALQTWLNTHDKADYPAPKPTPTPTPTSNASKIVAQAKKLAWAKGTAKAKYAWKGGSATSAFKAALNKAYPNRKSWGKAPKAGCSCDVFVGTVINTAGIGVSNFPRGFDQQKKYTNSHFNRYTYKNVTPYSVSKDGDIVMYYKKADGSSKHVLLRGNGYIYEAGFENTYGHTNTSLSKIKKKMPYVVILRAK